MGIYNSCLTELSSPFRCEYNRSTRVPGTFRNECFEAARLVQSRTKRPIALMLSGGLDSEIVLRSFIGAGVEITPFTYQIEEYSNHELRFVQKVLDDLGLKTNYIKIPRSWLNSQEAEEFFMSSKAYFVEMLPHMFAMKHVRIAPV